VAKNKNKKKQTEETIPEFDTTEIQKSLYKLVDDMLTLATDVAKEYDGVDTTELEELSGSVVQISENSPFLDEIFKGDSWKKVMSMSTAVNKMSGSKDNDSK